MFSSTRFVFARAAVPSVPKRDFTRATLLGRVGNEPELRNFENGTKVVSFNLAVDRTSPNWKSMTPEQRKKNTMWFRVYFFENPFLTKIVDEKVTKGSLVLVDGELTQRTITTKTGFESTITDLSLGNGGRIRVLRTHAKDKAVKADDAAAVPAAAAAAAPATPAPTA